MSDDLNKTKKRVSIRRAGTLEKVRGQKEIKRPGGEILLHLRIGRRELETSIELDDSDGRRRMRLRLLRLRGPSSRRDRPLQLPGFLRN